MILSILNEQYGGGRQFFKRVKKRLRTTGLAHHEHNKDFCTEYIALHHRTDIITTHENVPDSPINSCFSYFALTTKT